MKFLKERLIKKKMAFKKRKAQEFFSKCGIEGTEQIKAN